MGEAKGAGATARDAGEFPKRAIEQGVAFVLGAPFYDGIRMCHPVLFLLLPMREKLKKTLEDLAKRSGQRMAMDAETSSTGVQHLQRRLLQIGFL